MIISRGLSKSFKSFKKPPGLVGSIKSLWKREYTSKFAVNEFDLNIQKGEIVALLGPNGAGKTTLMKMMTGIVVPTSGELTVLGHKPWERDKNFRKKIALVMGQKSQLWWDIPAMDSFLLLQKYYEIPKAQFRERLEHMGNLMDVTRLFQIQVRRLSLGERMKLELMASLLHSPEVIFLDEPTIGLDLVAQENIREFIRNYHQKYGPTVVLTSHYMADVEALCQRLVLVFEGRKYFDGALSQFTQVLGTQKVLSFVFKAPVLEELSELKGLDAQWDETRRKVELRLPEEDLNLVARKILEHHHVEAFSTEKMPIERIMKALMNNPKLYQAEEK
jgi:ABC-2 type transport system ATP-binding protein